MQTRLGDSLVIFCYTSVLVNLEISGLVKDREGNIKAFGPEPWLIDGILPDTYIDGNQNVLVVPALIDGELLAVNVSTPDRNIQNGEVYVRGAIRKQGSDTIRAVLFADYISLPSPLTMPGSPVVSALAGPGLFKFASLENGVPFDVPGNSMIKILYLYAEAIGTAAGDITFEIEIDAQSGNMAFAYDSKISVADTVEVAKVSYFPGGGNKDLISQSISIPDNRLLPLGSLTLTIGGVSDSAGEMIKLGYMQWIYPYAAT